jgi:mycothiol synthase
LARAASLGATSLRGHLWIGSDGEGQATLDWVRRAGFAETARELVVALPLDGREPPAVDPPGGVRIVSWADEPGLAPQLHAIASEAIPDIPGEEDAVVPPLEEWLRNDMSGPYDRPEAVLVALAGDEAVGYAKLHLPAARGDVAVNDLTAVRRTWRGRGVAGALKRAQLGWAIRNGYASLETLNEERNAPIRALNARFGYRPAGTWVRVEGSTQERPAT